LLHNFSTEFLEGSDTLFDPPYLFVFGMVFVFSLILRGQPGLWERDEGGARRLTAQYIGTAKLSQRPDAVDGDGDGSLG
jgi:hypothetical protein